MDNKEIEIKLYVQDLQTVAVRLNDIGARQVQERTHEINLRFDTPSNELTKRLQVLRLRQDTAARMTFKGPAQNIDGVRVRQEIEFKIDDFESGRAFLEALGYQVSMMYEKYRSIYEYKGVHVTLDELPFGNFVEIEGPDAEHIRSVNQRLGLDWNAGVPESYIMLFDRLRREMGLEFRDLSFENFAGREITQADLKLSAADGQR